MSLNRPRKDKKDKIIFSKSQPELEITSKT